ncbi:hypothetical protein BH23GEM3_BH23GEM3_12700 [soil metagenome]|jgi:hypothetical protein|nr:hypothetical protein [Gemmatimonadota bacterium]
MQSEHFHNIRPSWVAFGWFIGAAVSAFLLFVFIFLGVLEQDSTTGDVLWVGLSLLLGFATGGFLAGVRTGAAPTLHGLLIGLFSLVVWLLANLIPGEATGATAWRETPIAQTLGMLVLLTVAAIVGARFGSRWTRRVPVDTV